MVPGFALHSELQIYQDIGVSPYEVIKTATKNAAEAMRKPGEFGEISVGARADLILLRKNPFEDIANLKSLDTVIAHGIILEQDDLNRIVNGIKNIYSQTEIGMQRESVSVDELKETLTALKKLAAQGYIIPDYFLNEVTEAYEKLGWSDQAVRVKSLYSH